jgi:carbamoyl-phosphate synthase large subunit
MYPEVDPLLGPEMRSTGEVLGLADSPGLAFYKAQEGAKQHLPTKGKVLISVSSRERPEVLKTAKKFTDLGFQVIATEGTHAFLAENGIDSKHIQKLHEGRPNITDSITNGDILLVINTPVGKLSQYDDSYIRKAAIKYKIPYITTLSAADAAADGIAAYQGSGSQIKPLQEYHSDIK